MKLRRNFALIAFALLVSFSAVAQKAPSHILPDNFAGWQRTGELQAGANPAAADPTQPEVLREYGFKDFEQGSFTKDDRKVTVRAARFNDASGAYGAFTFYRQPNMRQEQIGTLSASLNERVLFFRDNVLVDANFDRVTAMTAADLRQLAASLPSLNGPGANLPSIPQYLPRDQVQLTTAKYIIGPKAFEASGITVPSSVVDFSKSPEVLSTALKSDDGPAQLLLASYPTPQIAMERFESVKDPSKSGVPNQVASKRAGPILAVVTGNISQSNAKKILDRVNYEADVTWNEYAGDPKRDNIGTIVIAALTLAAVIFLFSVGTGVILGFGRVWLSKLFPSRFKAKEAEAEFIRLNIE